MQDSKQMGELSHVTELRTKIRKGSDRPVGTRFSDSQNKKSIYFTRLLLYIN